MPVLGDVRVFVKREDLIHPEICGNKFWKLLYYVRDYLASGPKDPLLITFGGAYSNHIAAVAALGREIEADTIGIIRGEELQGRWQQNATLTKASANGMRFRFVRREDYRHKDELAGRLSAEFPDALIIPEGGTNERAVEGVRFMLDERTEDFDHLCCAVGTGGTVAGISKFAAEGQKVHGFKVVRDDSLERKIEALSDRRNVSLIDASFGGYGKFGAEEADAVDNLSRQLGIPLEPVYTGKMFRKLLELINEGYFLAGSKILAFHTGGMQGAGRDLRPVTIR